MVGDTTLRIALTLWMCLGLDIDQMDVERTFLEDILEPQEYVYLKCLDRMKLEPDECLKDRKCLYGLVTSARISWRRFLEHLTSDSVGFQQSDKDQCLFWKYDKFGPILLLLYVDDSLCIGDKRDIDENMMLI